MGKGPSPPSPLDPNKIGDVQREENARAAGQNVALNRVNQVDARGNRVNYVRTGTDANGNPRYSVRQSLGAQGQQFNDGLQDLSNSYFAKAQDLLSKPLDPNQQVADQIDQLGRARLDPRFAREQAAMETQLANQGINRGSEAWSNASMDFNQGKNDAYNQLALTGQQQAYNQALSTRRNELSELQGLTSPGIRGGFEAINPSFADVPQISVPGVNMVDLYNQQYNQQYANYQQQLAQHQAMMGGLGWLGGSALGFALGGPTGMQMGNQIGSGAGSFFW